MNTYWLTDILRRNIVFVALLLATLTPSCETISSSQLMQKATMDAIFSKYDKRIRPTGANDTGPAVVNVNLMILDVRSISDVKMEYTTQLILRAKWIDQRLSYDNKGGRIHYLTLTQKDLVWIPDIFFKNEKEGHFLNIISPNSFIRIFPNGGVLYSTKISLTLSCPMNLHLFPLDRQQCHILIASYGWTTEDLLFFWKSVDPVQVSKILQLPRFTLESYITDYCSSRTNTGSYSCLKVDIIFKRELSYYMIQHYIPCCMLVILSWVSFWLDRNAVTARVLFIMIPMLALWSHGLIMYNTLPPVSYIKAIDVWNGVCMIFIFAAMLELALVNYASRSAMTDKTKGRKRHFEIDHTAAPEAAVLAEQQADDGRSAVALEPLVSPENSCMRCSSIEQGQPREIHLKMKRLNICQSWLAKFPTGSTRIDIISRITFPLLFALFNIVYWTTYL